MADFAAHIEPLVQKEGGYRLWNTPNDRGGRTYAGISERGNPTWRGWDMLRKGATAAEMRAAVHEQYRAEYWDPLDADMLQEHDVAEMMFSCSVLAGPRRAIILAQQVVEVQADGVMGPVTLAAINRMNPELFEARYALARINRFRVICNNDRSQRDHLLGWLNRVFGEIAS